MKSAVLLLALLFVTPVFGAVEKFIGCLYLTAEAELTVRWQAPVSGSPPERYEVRLRLLDRNTVYPVKDVGLVTETTVESPRAGHFAVEVRAVNAAGPGPWAASTSVSEAIVDGEPSAWQIFWKLAPPGPIVIE